MRKYLKYFLLLLFLFYGCSTRVIENYSDGKIKSEGYKLDNKMIGEWNFYYESGKLMAVGNYFKGNGRDSGVTGIPKNGREGKWIFLDENGKKEAESYYLNGKPDSIFEYFNTGNIKTIRRYKNGFPTDQWIKFYPSGVVFERRIYTDDTMNYEVIWYCPDGTLSGDRIKSKRDKYGEQIITSGEGFRDCSGSYYFVFQDR